MARRGRNANRIEVPIEGEADFGRARKEAKRDLDRIEGDAKGTAADIEKAFDGIELSPELDTADIRQAIDLANDLDGRIATLDIDTDLTEIRQAEQIARSLRAFQGRVDLSVEGREELKDALGLADRLDQIRQVKVQVLGRQDLQRAADEAEDLGDALVDAGERGAEGIGDAIGGIDFDGIGRTGLDQLTGALSAAGPWAAVAGGIGILFADEISGGFAAGWNRERRQVMRSIVSGLSPDDLAVTGRAAGAAFAAGFGDSLPQVQADADQLKAILGDLVDDVDMTDLVQQSQLLSEALGLDVTEAAEQARRAVKQGLADDWEDAFNDMAGATQEFRGTGLEALEIVNEFGTNFARFEVDGGRAVQFVADAFRDGLTPTIDRSGEAFEEFTTRIVDADAADAIAELGLNFRQIQADVAAGGDRANDAMSQVIERLLDYGGESDRARLSNIVFGQSFEQVTDNTELLTRMLELLSDETDAYVGKADEMSEAFESQVGGFTRFKNELTGGFVEIGGFARAAADDYFDLQDFLSEQYAGAIDKVTGSSDDLTESLTDFNQAPWDPIQRGLRDTADAAGDVTDDFADAADATDELEAAFAALEGRFDASSSLRRIQEQSESLLESVGDMEGGLFTAGGQFDRTDPQVRRFEQTLEDVNGTLIVAAQNLEDHTITTDQFRIMQHNAEEAIRQAGEAAGLTDAQVQALIDTYTAVPDQIGTDVTADTSQAHAELNRFLQAAESSRAAADVTADTSQAYAELNRFLYSAGRSRATATARVSGNSVVTRRASGGPATGLVMTGEEGRELLDLGSARGFVYDHATTERMMAGNGGGGGEATVRIVLDAPGFRQFLREDVQSNGGVNVYFGET